MPEEPTKRSGRARPSSINWCLALVAALAVAGTFGFAAARSRAHDPVVNLHELPDTAIGYAIGAATAPVTIVVFADFQCEACAIAARRVEEPLRRGAVAAGAARLQWVATPNPSHRFATIASVAAACAARQGRFGAMHDILYAHQSEWADPQSGSKRASFVAYAEQAGADTVSWGACYDDPASRAAVDAQHEIARRVGVRGTPTYIVGNKVIEGVPTLGALESALAAARP